MENLEEYIRKHREEMDRYKPSRGIWREIQKKINPGYGSRSRWFTAAAMIAVIIGIAVALFRPGRQKTGSERSYEAILKSNSELREAAIYYNNLANSLYREVTPMLTKNPELEKELSSDISQIDSLCSEIKKDLNDNVANQDVIEALIQNYRIKTRILEDMLELLKENEKKPVKDNNHEL